MKALGMICGVGSMLIGAKRQGWDVIGNIEWRPYYHTGTFEHNFPGAFMVPTIKDLTPEQHDQCCGVDLLIGHTECGNFSNLRMVKKEGDIGDIPQYVEAIQTFKPKFFAMDNLPKALEGFSSLDWAEALPDYDIFFEWISNYGYGNVQKYRKRLFVIGSRKELGFTFIPGEFEHSVTVRDRIQDVDPLDPNQVYLDPRYVYDHWRRYNSDPDFVENRDTEANRLTFGDFQKVLAGCEIGQPLMYYNRKGERKKKIGWHLTDIDSFSPVLTGGGHPGLDCVFRADTLQPFTIRERARIQGCPDDFVFLPCSPEAQDRVGKERMMLIKQTGKFMPVEFCTYLTAQFKAFLEGRIPDECTGHRTLNPNPLIDQNKFDYCSFYGYSDQESACRWCGSKAYCKTHQAPEPKPGEQLKLWPDEDLL